jgi:hypothetical protein
MWTCPKCERELAGANQWHHCAKVAIGDLFRNRNEELEFVFDQLLAQIAEWENVAVSATKNCIVFVRNKTFLIVRPMKTQLDLKLYSEKEQAAFPVVKTAAWNSKFEHHIRIATSAELTADVFHCIRQSYFIS